MWAPGYGSGCDYCLCNLPANYSPLARRLHLVCLQIAQFRKQLLVGLSRPTLHFGIQNFGPSLPPTHASSVTRLYRAPTPLDTLTTSY